MGDEEAGEKPVIGKSLLEKFCHLLEPRGREDIVMIRSYTAVASGLPAPQFGKAVRELCLLRPEPGKLPDDGQCGEGSAGSCSDACNSREPSGVLGSRAPGSSCARRFVRARG